MFSDDTPAAGATNPYTNKQLAAIDKAKKRLKPIVARTSSVLNDLVKEGISHDDALSIIASLGV